MWEHYLILFSFTVGAENLPPDNIPNGVSVNIFGRKIFRPYGVWKRIWGIYIIIYFLRHVQQLYNKV